MKAAKIPLSACVIAMNEADRIDACLAALAFCDEIVVLDSGSTDDTAARCRAAGARTLVTDWPGWVAQKQRAVDAAQHDWVLCVDADERVDGELRAAIEAWQAAPQHGDGDAASGPRAFAVRRRVRFLGRWIRHGGWYPEWRVRLFDRRAARWGGQDPHDHVDVEGPVGRIDVGHLEHHTFRSLNDYIEKVNRFSSAAAQAKHARGRRANAFDLLVRPGWRFFWMYVVRLGFLDGRAGLTIARTAAFGVFLKYAKLWDLDRQSPTRA